jgi:hypothetical protein
LDGDRVKDIDRFIRMDASGREAGSYQERRYVFHVFPFPQSRGMLVGFAPEGWSAKSITSSGFRLFLRIPFRSNVNVD